MDAQPAFEDTQPVAEQQGQPAFEDTEPTKEQQPDFQDTQPIENYQSPGQQAATVAEGVAKGATAGLSTAFETADPQELIPNLAGHGPIGILAAMGKKLLGQVPQEDIAGRKAANPGEAISSEIAGNIGLSSLLPESQAVGWAKTGADALKAGISSGLFQTGDEISDGFLGNGNPMPAAAAHIAGMTGLGLLLGPVTSKALDSVAALKAGTAAKSFITGMGHSANFPSHTIVPLSESALLPEESKGLSNMAFKAGQLAYKAKTAGLGSIVGDIVGGHSGAGIGALIGQNFNRAIEPYVSRFSQNVAGPMLMRAAASGTTQNLAKVLDASTSIARGNKVIEKGIEGLFSAGPQKVYEENISDKDIDKIKNYIDNGGVDQEIQTSQQQPQGYAEGGEVISHINEKNPISDNFPEHNLLLTAAKTRVSNYLKSAKPQSKNKLTYDSDRENPQEERSYDKVIKIAHEPLSVLNKIKQGSLIPDDVKHLSSMYPEIYQTLSEKMTKRMMKGQLKEEKRPPYHVRQAMSLFLGASLDSTLTPMAMQNAQAVFHQQKAQQAGQVKSSALNKVGSQSQTAEQSRTARLNKS